MQTRKEQIKMVKKYPFATRAGWLLACDAPKLVTKGECMLKLMSEHDKSIAWEYRDHCLDAYESVKS